MSKKTNKAKELMSLDISADKRAELGAALQSVREGAKESRGVHLYTGEINGTVSYVRTRRGIYCVVRGPDGQDFGECLVP